MSKKIIICISPNSDIKVETEDYKGEVCVKVIKQLFASFLEIDNFDLKSDYYEDEVNLDRSVKIDL
jgi:hypothetical protein